MRRILFIVLFILVFAQLAFADEAEVCQGCQDACYAIAESGAPCNAMDSEDDRATFAGICAFQCKVVYNRDGYCPSGQSLWDGQCGNNAPEDCVAACQERCRGLAQACNCVGVDSSDTKLCEAMGESCAGQCKIIYERDGYCLNGQQIWDSWCQEWGGVSTGGQPAPGNECQGVSCADHCEGMVSYYDGECVPSGECIYLSEECEFACNPSTGRCEKNTEPPEIILETTPSSVVISGKEEVDIMVQLVRETGEAVEGAEVYFRVSDPEFTGLLGDWGFMDVKKSTDGGGIASATLGLPSMKSIDRIHYEEFPLELQVEITAAKHSGGEDWSVKKTGVILVESPVPEITGMSISPDPAQAYWIHMLGIEVQDADEGPKNLKYTIRCFGGKLGTHTGEASNSDQYSRVFYSGETSESIEWTGPSQGIDENAPVEFDAHMSNLEGLSKNLGANRFGVVGGVYKAASGLNGNAQSLAQGFHSLTQSESWKEGAYRTLDLGLEGFKTFVGVYTLGFKAAPGALGKLSNDAGDFVDAGIGSMQAKLKGLAHGARANEADTRITEYACAAIVEDSDGYADWYLYEFELEYEGFESDKRYGKDDEVSG